MISSACTPVTSSLSRYKYSLSAWSVSEFQEKNLAAERKGPAKRKTSKTASNSVSKETILLVSPAHRSNSEVTIQSFLSILTSFSNLLWFQWGPLCKKTGVSQAGMTFTTHC
jgi:hypothetical protein